MHEPRRLQQHADVQDGALCAGRQGIVKGLPVPMMTEAIVSAPSMYRTAANTPTVSLIRAPILAWMPCTTECRAL